MVPGFVDLKPWQDQIVGVPVIVTVDDEEIHRSHFAVRASDAPGRPVQRYMEGFGNIRKVQKYVKSQALSHGVPVIPNYNLDQAIGAVIDLVVEKATERAAKRGAQEGRNGEVEEVMSR